ncbi:MAG: hypothetical protein ACYSOT_01045, partial [Planctomycetota bacterium]
MQNASLLRQSRFMLSNILLIPLLRQQPTSDSQPIRLRILWSGNAECSKLLLPAIVCRTRNASCFREKYKSRLEGLEPS